jgi:ABC-2 type transport system permease protein
MKNRFSSKFWWITVIVIIVTINWFASAFHARADLTEERRFTLSAPTKKLLSDLPDNVTVRVLLAGDMPAAFKKLSQSTNELLQEFKELGKGNLKVIFERPGEGLDDSAKAKFISFVEDSLGLKPTNVKVTAKQGEAQEERLVYAGAIVSSRGRDIAVNLLQGQSLQGGYEALNNAEALLEYKFAHAIQKVTEDHVPVVGYLVGNGQPLSYNVYDLIERTLKPNYGFGFVPIDSVPVIPLEFNAIFIVKPSKPFTDKQKLKIDQYVMHGGKVIWMIDNLYAEMDSLMRSQSDFIAFDRGLELDDILFKYGARINRDLVQDLQSDKFPLVVGNMGNQPQMQLVPWPYFPLLSSYSDHPISKNLDNILSIFPNSLDTIATPGIRKTVLLATSENSRSLSTPAIVSLNSVKTEEDLKTFDRKHIPIAVLLEGKFSSLYSNRLPASMADTLSKIYRQPFRNSSDENSMIVVSDADIAMNVVTQNEGPLPMGRNQFTGITYANRDFVLNSVEYLVNPSGILEARSKDITLRLLDPKKIESDKLTWQLISIGLPVLLVLVFGATFQAIRKRQFAA